MGRFFLSFLFLLMGVFMQGRTRITEFLPQITQTRKPAVILCPGGSYHYLGMKIEGERVAKWLNKNGIAAFVLRYRVAPSHFPAMIQDLQKAIFYCRQNAEKLGIDPKRVGVMGFSAGGHLAGISAIYGDVNYIGQLGKHISLRPDFVAMIYPVVSMTNEKIVHRKSRRGLLGTNPSIQMLDSLSLEKKVHRGMPPLFIVHCKMDNVVDYHNSVELSNALDRVGCEYRLLLYETGTHGFGIDHRKGREALMWTEEFMKWFENLRKDE